jgi:hypothetical protein
MNQVTKPKTPELNEPNNGGSNYRGKRSVDHVDPINHTLVCGLKNQHNEVEAGYSYNSRKTNHFVPYRVCGFPAPNYFGDFGEFLINDEWVVCEFGGSTWWEESNRVGNNHTAPASEKQKAAARKVGARNKASGLLSRAGKKGGKISGPKNGRKNVESGHLDRIRSWKYRCLVTNYVSTAAGLSTYQKARGIDTSLRVKVS